MVFVYVALARSEISSRSAWAEPDESTQIIDSFFDIQWNKQPSWNLVREHGQDQP